MAAPDKSSPSNQPIQKTKDIESSTDSVVTLKDPPQEVAAVASKPSPTSPAVAVAAATNSATASAVVVPTYESSESSEAYIKAKQLLAAGAFEDALETVAEAISVVTSMLSVENQETHESLAPLQYLYGTTLLYSVEETDSSADPMVQQQQQQQAAEEEQADDLQIAWENLESARHIVSELISSSSPAMPETKDQKLKLDLAQIHLRLGDLQRTNGRYMDAISDYTSCLELRKPILGEYDRKVADAYYMLGLVSNMLASEGDKQLDEQKNQDTNNGTAAAAAAGEPEQPTLSPAQIEEYRTKSIENFLLCSKSIAGIISTLCGADPKEIIGSADEDAKEDEKPPASDSAPTPAAGKTTGLELSDLLLTNASRTLRTIRTRIADKFLNSKASATSSSTQDDIETVKELAEMLDEIQETIDEAENTKKGLHDVAEIKANAQAAIEKSDAAEAGGASGEASNPWAAFGSSTSSGKADAKEGTTTIGFGSSSVATSTATAAAPTMMVVKKKKKRDATDSKLAATTLVPKKKVKESPTE
mmetsp:Transcript_25161/g.35440  ORF Transcript_25161/g.35440 Transcript_25161/m.35440 type:complete len:534 (+) Transcript_25161:112-1713(+)